MLALHRLRPILIHKRLHLLRIHALDPLQLGLCAAEFLHVHGQVRLHCFHYLYDSLRVLVGLEKELGLWKSNINSRCNRRTKNLPFSLEL